MISFLFHTLKVRIRKGLERDSTHHYTFVCPIHLILKFLPFNETTIIGEYMLCVRHCTTFKRGYTL